MNNVVESLLHPVFSLMNPYINLFNSNIGKLLHAVPDLENRLLHGPLRLRLLKFRKISGDQNSAGSDTCSIRLC